MDTHHTLFLARWVNGTFSIHYGTGPYPMVETLDMLDTPYDAEVRAIPPCFAGVLCLRQRKRGGPFHVESSDDYLSIEELWSKCNEQLWPTDDPTVPKRVAE